MYELGQPYRGMDEGELRLAVIDYLMAGEGSSRGLVLLVFGSCLRLRLLLLPGDGNSGFIDCLFGLRSGFSGGLAGGFRGQHILIPRLVGGQGQGIADQSYLDSSASPRIAP